MRLHALSTRMTVLSSSASGAEWLVDVESFGAIEAAVVHMPRWRAWIDLIFQATEPPIQHGDADLRSFDSASRLIAAETRNSKLVTEKNTLPMQADQKHGQIPRFAREARLRQQQHALSSDSTEPDGTISSSCVLHVGTQIDTASSRVIARIKGHVG